MNETQQYGLEWAKCNVSAFWTIPRQHNPLGEGDCDDASLNRAKPGYMEYFTITYGCIINTINNKSAVKIP